MYQDFFEIHKQFIVLSDFRLDVAKIVSKDGIYGSPLDTPLLNASDASLQDRHSG